MRDLGFKVNEQVEEVDLSDLLGSESESESEGESKGFNIADYHLHISIAGVIIAIIALVAAIIGFNQADEFAERPRSESSLRNELSRKIPDDVRVRNITVLSTDDSVTATITFFPQSSIYNFAADCRAVLDVMKSQNAVYDEILFIAEDAFTKIRAEVSGRFSMDITVEEIVKITHYFGLVEDSPDITDIGDI